MNIYNIYSKRMCTGVSEKCVLNDRNEYIGVETGLVYSANDYYHRERLRGKIISVDEENKTGMYHLYQECNDNEESNNKSWKKKFVGCFVTLEKAHYADDVLVYLCLELNEYFSENEIELL